MKKAIEAPDMSVGRVSQEERAAIYAEVINALKAAEERTAAAAARSEARTPAAAVAPTTNRGGKSGNDQKTGQIGARLVLENGEVKEIPARRTWGGDSAFLDWVNFTTDEVDFMFGMNLISDEQIIDRVSMKLCQIFGFGITAQRETGANFYKRSYVLGDNCGMVCHGGQRSTVLVMLSGEGCAAAKDGWEHRLYEFLTKCGPRAKLTRVDLAHDDYSGSTYSVDKADQDFDNGLFNCGGRHPNHEYRGNWKRPNGKGRTVYVGNRENGKFCRVYEKGRQLGDKNSEWVRIEVEMKSVSRILDFEILLHPGRYLAAAYPAFAFISAHQERILTTQKKTQITYAAMCKWAKTQLGAFVNVLVEMEGDAEKAVQKIIKLGAIPARLKNPSWSFGGEYFHDEQRTQPSEEQFFEAAFA